MGAYAICDLLGWVWWVGQDMVLDGWDVHTHFVGGNE